MKYRLIACAGILLTHLFAGSKVQAIQIETVFIGDAGNTADATGYGAVPYNYAMSKYDVTIGQYTAFLNAVAKTDAHALYYNQMSLNLIVAGIARTGVSGSYSYSVMDNGGNSANRPITYVNWFDAARFANWMANGQPTGAQGNATTENGAYTLNGAMSGINFTKNTVNPNTLGLTTFWIPTLDEWYKAAYYDPSKGGSNYWLYPTRSDNTPGNIIGSGANQANYHTSVYSVTQNSTYDPNQNYLTDVGAFSGSASHYGTYDQGGAVYQWTDTVVNTSYRSYVGGGWTSNNYNLNSFYQNNTIYDPGTDNAVLGFRLASIPEPSTFVLCIIAVAFVLVRKKQVRNSRTNSSS